jgi:hypothetical protein
MEDLNNIEDLHKKLPKSDDGWNVLAYAKKHYVIVGLITTLTGGMGAWVGNLQVRLNNIDNIPVLMNRQDSIISHMGTMHGVMKMDTAIFNKTFRKMKGLIDTLPLLYYKANVMERDFVRVKKRQDEVIEGQEEMKDEMFTFNKNLRTIDRRTRTERSVSAQF